LRCWLPPRLSPLLAPAAATSSRRATCSIRASPPIGTEKFDQSIEDFKQAKDLDPTLMNARLYLATAYATQYIPGAPSEENIRMGEAAIKEFQDVLSVDPNNISAIDGIGSILFNMGWDAVYGVPSLRNRRPIT